MMTIRQQNLPMTMTTESRLIDEGVGTAMKVPGVDQFKYVKQTPESDLLNRLAKTAVTLTKSKFIAP